MKISFWKILTIFNIVSNWAAQALADKKITREEAYALVEQLAAALGVPTELDLTDKLK